MKGKEGRNEGEYYMRMGGSKGEERYHSNTTFPGGFKDAKNALFLI
jgi:hypothetical protein